MSGKQPPIAVALRYESGGVPVVVAKGRGTQAQRIVDTAEQAGVFVEEDALLAEALSAVELDDEIPVELYRAVAQVIGFVLDASARS